MPKAGLEPAHPKAPPPQDGASTNSATSAYAPNLSKFPACAKIYVSKCLASKIPKLPFKHSDSVNLFEIPLNELSDLIKTGTGCQL